MTPTEIITTSLAGVALIVAWLARLDSEKSADAAQKSNDLMAEQLKLTTSELNRQQKKEIEESRSLFVWKDGSSGGDRFDRQFQNVGGEVYDLTVQTSASEITPSVHPNNYLARNDIGTIVFMGKRIFPISFIISCKTKLAERFEKRYALTMDGIVEA